MELDDGSGNMRPIRVCGLWSSANARAALLGEALHGVDEGGRAPEGFGAHRLAVAPDAGLFHDPIYGDSEGFFLS